jgi:hypothetical protein
MTTLATPTAPPSPDAGTTTALLVGIHQQHGRPRLLLRLPGGRCAISLPLEARDIDRLPPPAARSTRGMVRWFTPPLPVHVRTAGNGHGLVFAGLAVPVLVGSIDRGTAP